MGIQVIGNGGTVAEVDGTTWRSLRATLRSEEFGSLGAYRLGMRSGTMPAALAANSEIFQFRWPDATRLCLVKKVTISAAAILAATTALNSSFRMCVARSWTTAGSGGTRAVLTGNNCKLRTSMGTSLVNDAGISSTAALTTGTKTLDTEDLASVAFGIGTGAITTSMPFTIMPRTILFDSEDTLGHPLVLAQNEGFVVRTGLVFPATMTWGFCVDVQWSEVNSF